MKQTTKEQLKALHHVSETIINYYSGNVPDEIQAVLADCFATIMAEEDEFDLEEYINNIEYSYEFYE